MTTDNVQEKAKGKKISTAKSVRFPKYKCEMKIRKS